jgi:hypothetical protein
VRLQDKINAYLDFIESGQLDAQQNSSIPAGAQMVIVVAVQVQPSADAEAFFEDLRELLARAELGFEVDRELAN